jgi:hypothetical protein
VAEKEEAVLELLEAAGRREAEADGMGLEAEASGRLHMGHQCFLLLLLHRLE